MVLIFCVEIQKLSHLTRDLCQAEKKITVVQAQQVENYFTQNDDFDHFD
jgi:hypothetical protein